MLFNSGDREFLSAFERLFFSWLGDFLFLVLMLVLDFFEILEDLLLSGVLPYSSKELSKFLLLSLLGMGDLSSGFLSSFDLLNGDPLI